MSTRDRARGALIGLAAGDAVGTTLEFRTRGTFDPITDMVGGGPFGLRAGQWTDDTSMAMCLAESLLDTGEQNLTDQMRRYCQWRRSGYWSSTGRCFDIGATTARALDRFERSGDYLDSPIDPQRAANGSLMRLAPVPIRWHTDSAVAARRSGDSSRTTHGADRPVDACRLAGAMIAALIQGVEVDEVFGEEFWAWGVLDPKVLAVARGSWRHKEPPEIRGSGYVVEALEAAIWAVVGADDFADAVLRAANLGDDADTTAAIAGQLAGARWGLSGIPQRWVQRLSLRDRILAIADGLHDAAIEEHVWFSEPDSSIPVADTSASDTTRAEPVLPQVWEHDELVHAYWVEPEVILAGEYPGSPASRTSATSKLDLLVDRGVRTFVDLTAPADRMTRYDDVLADIAEFRGLELAHLRRPIPDMGTVDASGYDEIVATIRHATGQGAVYVHCWGGIGRTGTVVGCSLVDSGMDADTALRRIEELRAPTRKSHVRAPQTAAQIEVLRSRARRSRGPAPTRARPSGR